MKGELKKVKGANPGMEHKEAFLIAAKNVGLIADLRVIPSLFPNQIYLLVGRCSRKS